MYIYIQISPPLSWLLAYISKLSDFLTPPLKVTATEDNCLSEGCNCIIMTWFKITIFPRQFSVSLYPPSSFSHWFWGVYFITACNPYKHLVSSESPASGMRSRPLNPERPRTLVLPLSTFICVCVLTVLTSSLPGVWKQCALWACVNFAR